jgi:hypothetical protein
MHEMECGSNVLSLVVDAVMIAGGVRFWRMIVVERNVFYTDFVPDAHWSLRLQSETRRDRA